MSSLARVGEATLSSQLIDFYTIWKIFQSV